jgi:hypothetical protein
VKSKFIAAILVALLINTGSSLSLNAASPTNGFKDLTDSPNKTYIEELTKLGIFDGLGLEFKPYQNISRGEYIAWLVTANNRMRTAEHQIQFAPWLQPQFSDVPKTHPCYKWIQAMSNTGYSIGYTDKTFKPNQAITREEMIAIKSYVDYGDTHATGNLFKYNDLAQVDARFKRGIIDDAYWTDNNMERAFGSTKSLKPKQAVMRFEAAGTIWGFGNSGQCTAHKILERGGRPSTY